MSLFSVHRGPISLLIGALGLLVLAGFLIARFTRRAGGRRAVLRRLGRELTATARAFAGPLLVWRRYRRGLRRLHTVLAAEPLRAAAERAVALAAAVPGVQPYAVLVTAAPPRPSGPAAGGFPAAVAKDSTAVADHSVTGVIGARRAAPRAAVRLDVADALGADPSATSSDRGKAASDPSANGTDPNADPSDPSDRGKDSSGPSANGAGPGAAATGPSTGGASVAGPGAVRVDARAVHRADPEAAGASVAAPGAVRVDGAVTLRMDSSTGGSGAVGERVSAAGAGGMGRIVVLLAGRDPLPTPPPPFTADPADPRRWWTDPAAVAEAASVRPATNAESAADRLHTPSRAVPMPAPPVLAAIGVSGAAVAFLDLGAGPALTVTTGDSRTGRALIQALAAQLTLQRPAGTVHVAADVHPGFRGPSAEDAYRAAEDTADGPQPFVVCPRPPDVIGEPPGVRVLAMTGARGPARLLQVAKGGTVRVIGTPLRADAAALPRAVARLARIRPTAPPVGPGPTINTAVGLTFGAAPHGGPARGTAEARAGADPAGIDDDIGARPGGAQPNAFDPEPDPTPGVSAARAHAAQPPSAAARPVDPAHPADPLGGTTAAPESSEPHRTTARGGDEPAGSDDPAAGDEFAEPEFDRTAVGVSAPAARPDDPTSPEQPRP